jgi:molecular chaperone DnaK
MLSKNDVDKMVRDASEHAEEDRRRREEVDTRNQAEALTFQAERTLKDLADKVSSEDKSETEAKITALRDALKGNDMDAVHRGMDELQSVLARVATAAYQASAASGESPNGSGPDQGGAPEGEETVEGEFKEV